VLIFVSFFHPTLVTVVASYLFTSKLM